MHDASPQARPVIILKTYQFKPINFMTAIILIGCPDRVFLNLSIGRSFKPAAEFESAEFLAG